MEHHEGVEPLRKEWQVKMYHPGTGCDFAGKSEWFEFACSQRELRTQVELQQTGILFVGDKCRLCGELAKVTPYSKNEPNS